MKSKPVTLDFCVRFILQISFYFFLVKKNFAASRFIFTFNKTQMVTCKYIHVSVFSVTFQKNPHKPVVISKCNHCAASTAETGSDCVTMQRIHHITSRQVPGLSKDSRGSLHACSSTQRDVCRRGLSAT